MRIGGIYVNGWAGESNPQRAGLYLGRRGKHAEFMAVDGKRFLMDPKEKAMRLAGTFWHKGELRRALDAAARDEWPAANEYAREVLWPKLYPKEHAARLAAAKIAEDGT